MSTANVLKLASRFSKLFMAHLDSEFQKQLDPTLKSLVADQVRTALTWLYAYMLTSSQFQGKQVYTTVCSKCHIRSERESEFLELELTLAVS